MALVAYDVSDASDEEENASVPDVEQIIETKPGDTIINKEPDSLIHAALPTPKTKSVFFYSDLSQKLLSNTIRNSNSKKSVKITVPSLSDFDEDLPTPTTKKASQSTKGSGLFALLPPPKNAAAKATENKLVPDSLRKKPAPKPASVLPVKIHPKPVLAQPIAEDIVDEDDDAEDTSDFLGLNSRFETDLESSSVVLDIPESQHFSVPSVPVAPPESAKVDDPAEVEEDNSVYPPKGDYINMESEELELDDEALQKLCGGNKRRRTNVPTNLIDVSDKDVAPDREEWLVKHLSEENTHKSYSHKKHAGPSTQQRRKHQITYLAYQAKEQELDLQNQWAQNRMTKKQTQSKYGF